MLSPERILIRQDLAKDGIIEIRPGNPELDLGERKYAQVRIRIGASNKFIKGMAVYSNEVPEEYDVVFYTRFKNDTGTLAGYGTSARAMKIIEIVEENGYWKAWTDSLTESAKKSDIRKAKKAIEKLITKDLKDQLLKVLEKAEKKEAST